MLIGICGGECSSNIYILVCLPIRGICAGKHSVAEYLTKKHGFKRLSIARLVISPGVAPQRGIAVPRHVSSREDIHFPDVGSLVEFITERWRERWVMTDIWNEEELKDLQKRPSFILISVDAPVSLRWERYKQRFVESSSSSSLGVIKY